MKSYFNTTFFLIFTIYTLGQQLNTSIGLDNFVSSNNAAFNPSSIVDSKTKLAFSSSLSYFSVSNFKSRKFQPYTNYNMGINSKYIEHRKKGYLISGFTSDIISVKYELNHSNAFGYALRYRYYDLFSGISEVWAKNSINRYTNNIINVNENIAGFTIADLDFTEHAFTYARTMFDRKKEFLKAGVTVKILNGLSGDYFHLKEGSIVFTDSLYGYATLSNVDAQFGMNITNSQSFYKGNGFGFDIGFTYEYRPKYEKQYYEMDGKTKNVRYDINKYKFKFGASLTDIGKVRFVKDTGSYNFTNPSQSLIAEALYNDSYNGNIFESIQNQVQAFGTKTTQQDFQFKMSLPATLNVNLDYNYKKNIYVSYNLSLPLNFPGTYTKVYHPFIHTITPRVEGEKYSIMLPFSQQANGKFYLGLAGRINTNRTSFYMGSNNIALLLGQKASLTRSFFVGISYSIAYELPSDIDFDKISDGKDLCPDDYGPIEFQGCPDTDGDEIPDKEDFCIYHKGTRETNGCPDTDGDGIIDMNDMCPNVPGLGVHYGCPDRDFDGVIDMVDQCPDVPGIELNNGCPFENPGCCMDNDGDGVSNSADKCPDHAGSVYNHGCPIDSININQIDLKKQKEKFDPNHTQEQIRVLKNKDTVLNFISNKEDLRALINSKEVLEEHNVYFGHDQSILVEDELRLFDQFFRTIPKQDSLSLMVIGYTDRDGSLDYNLILSKKRAETVKRKLIEYGFPEEQIVLYYFGETKSLKKETYSEEQKRLDRRVEIKLIRN